MVKLTAAKTVDNSNLSELGLLSNWSALTGPSTVADRSSIAVSSGSVDMTVSGQRAEPHCEGAGRGNGQRNCR